VTRAELLACAAALARHRTSFEHFSRSATEFVLERLPAGHAIRVLDVASGVGDPALAIAAKLGPHGCVTATDQLAELLHELTREAWRRTLNNVHTCRADMHALPLASASVHCVVSRLGLQQARDPGLALREARRLLCAGGRALYVAWGRADQPLFRHTVLEPLERCGGPRFREGEAGPFRFAAEGALASAARKEGLRVLEAQECEAPWCWPGSAGSLWQATRETSAPLFEPLLAKLTRRERAALEDRVLQQTLPYEREGSTIMPVYTQTLLVEKG